MLQILTAEKFSTSFFPASDSKRETRIQVGLQTKAQRHTAALPRSPALCLQGVPTLRTVLELPWLSLSKRNFRFDLGEFLFFISAGGWRKAKRSNNPRANRLLNQVAARNFNILSPTLPIFSLS